MGRVADRIAAAGLTLPQPSAALGAYVPSVRSGSLVFTAGQLPLVDGALIANGRVGDEVAVDVARDCAQRCVLNALAAASVSCDLDEVVRVVKVTGYVASAPGFTAQPGVIDAASELLVTIFGDSGKHAREAVGVTALPLGAPVEISLVLEVACFSFALRPPTMYHCASSGCGSAW